MGAGDSALNPGPTKKSLYAGFKVTCKSSVPPHPFLGRVIYTQDPGRALISGKCNDVGTIVMQQFRGWPRGRRTSPTARRERSRPDQFL